MTEPSTDTRQADAIADRLADRLDALRRELETRIDAVRRDLDGKIDGETTKIREMFRDFRGLVLGILGLVVALLAVMMSWVVYEINAMNGTVTDTRDRLIRLEERMVALQAGQDGIIAMLEENAADASRVGATRRGVPPPEGLGRWRRT